jgi:hypothetical protein
MTDLDETQLIPAETEEEPPVSANLLAALAAERAKVAGDSHFDVVVPGWGGCLVLRLGSVSGEQQARIFQRIQKGASIERVQGDYVLAAFQAVLGRYTPDGDLEPILDGEGVPMGLDDRLAAALKLGPVGSARDVLFGLYAKANSPSTALSAAGSEWLEWAKESSSEVDEAFVGE